MIFSAKRFDYNFDDNEVRLLILTSTVSERGSLISCLKSDRSLVVK